METLERQARFMVSGGAGTTARRTGVPPVLLPAYICFFSSNLAILPVAVRSRASTTRISRGIS